MNFKCLPIDYVEDTKLSQLRLQSTQPRTSISCPISDCRINIETRNRRHIHRKSDYIPAGKWEVVGSLISTTVESDELKILQLLSRPNIYSRDLYDYRIQTARGIYIDVSSKVEWMDDASTVDVENIGTFTIHLLDDFK